MARKLFVDRLLASGFEEVECWSLGEERLNPPKNLPAKRGVYAFAIGDEVQYVGLASRSLKQRLNFYARPGASQKTNLRLNVLISDLIRQEQTVRILLAHPEDFEWNGLRCSGSEGLEAALIEDFDLPWNVRGSNTPVLFKGGLTQGTVSTAIVEYVRNNPRCTELQIAKAIFGPDAVQPQANAHCRKLVERQLLERLPTRPFTYLAT